MIPEGDPAFDDILSTTRGASAQCGRTGYWVSGYANSYTDPRIDEDDGDVPVPGLITYDLDTETWSNESTAALTSESGGALLHGRAVCVEGRDEAPLVVMLGGETTSATSILSGDLRNMDNITFWDPEAGRWYWQQANGAIPDRRKDFCAVSVQGSDGRTEIFVYGGQGDESTFSDMHVLTIPGFRWFGVEDFDSPPRVHQACVPVGPKADGEENDGSTKRRQMLISGGLTNDTKSAWSEYDAWPYALGLFDMTDLEWKAEYDPEAGEYETPKMIRDWYNDNGMDSVSWSSDSVKKFFVEGKQLISFSWTLNVFVFPGASLSTVKLTQSLQTAPPPIPPTVEQTEAQTQIQTQTRTRTQSLALTLPSAPSQVAPWAVSPLSLLSL